MRFRAPGDSSNTAVIVAAGQSTAKLQDVTSSGRWFFVRGRTGAKGTIEIELRGLGSGGAADGQAVRYFGIEALGYHASDDIGERLDLLEGIVVRNESVILPVLAGLSASLAACVSAGDKIPH